MRARRSHHLPASRRPRRKRRQLQRHRRRSLGIVRIGGDRRRHQRADRRGARGRRERRRSLRPDRPASLRLHHQGHRPGFRARRIHRRTAGGGARVPARPDPPGRRRHRGRHGQGQRDGDGPQLGPHRRQRHRARGGEPAGERAPDVAADAAGAGFAERRHRHLERRPLQRPRQPAERDQVRWRRGLGDHRRRAGQHRRPDLVAVQAAGQPRERAGVPRRVEQLSGRVRHRDRRPGQRHHQVRLEPRVGLAVRVLPQRQPGCPELLRLDPQHRRQRHPGTAEVGAQPAPVRRLDRRTGAEEPRLPLRQLRGLPPRRRRQLRRSRAERGRMVAGGAGHRAAPSGLHVTGRRAAAGRVGQPGLRHLPAAEPRERRGELGQRPLRLPDERAVVVIRPRLPRPRHADASGRRQRPRRAGHERPDQRHLQRPGHAELRPADRVQGRLQRAEGRHPRPRSGRQRHRLRRPGVQPERLDRQHRHRRTERLVRHRGAWRPGARQQRHQRPRRHLRSVVDRVRQHHHAGPRQPSRQVRRRRPVDRHDLRPAGRHDLLVRQHRRVPAQPAVGHPVRRRHQLAERVQQRRDRDARDPAAVLRRLRPGRMEGCRRASR